MKNDLVATLPSQRWLVGPLSKSEKALSERLKQGLCDTLALLSVHGESAEIKTSINIDQWSEKIVYEVLAQNNPADWKNIRLLAEASPNAFMDTLENAIKANPNFFTLQCNNDSFRLNAIYQALQELAWDNLYVSQAALLLANPG